MNDGRFFRIFSFCEGFECLIFDGVVFICEFILKICWMCVFFLDIIAGIRYRSFDEKNFIDTMNF